MRFTELPVAGAFVIDLDPIEDDRGFFARSYGENEFRERGLETGIVQCNVSWNRYRGTLRGLHYQAAPHEETKLVRCSRGSVWDVIVELSTRQWTAIELSADNRRAVYIPRGMAHGFITLADDSELEYMMGAAYVAEASRGVAWDDPAFGIEWPIEPAVISERDRNYPRWTI